MAEKKASNEDSTFRIVILLVFSLAGGFSPFFSSQYYGFYYGLFWGFLIGIAVLLTVEYASTKIRRN